MILIFAFSLWFVAVWLQAPQAGDSGQQRVADNSLKQDELIDGEQSKILARVNGEPVTQAALRRSLAEPHVRWKLKKELNVEDPDSKELHRLALQKLIHRRLFLQEAGRQKITISQQLLDQTLLSLRSRFADLETFGGWMKERGFDDRLLFGSIRDDMLVAQVVTGLTAGVEITRQQVHDYYESHRLDLTIGEEVRLRIIVVNSSAAALDILTALRNGQNFNRLAQKLSLGLRAAQGGDTGWINAQTLPPPLRRVVDLLRAGEASRPLQKGPDEFLIVGLVARRALQIEHLDDAFPVIEQHLLVTKRQETIQTWLTQQEQNSNIELFL